jgi:transcriptional regulator with XRE-family HTH domain
MSTSSPPVEPQLIRRAADVGPLVRARRHAQALRIDDAAALTGVSVDLFSRLENGKGAVRLDKLLTVLDGLGLALVVGPKEHPAMRLPSRPVSPPSDQP